MKERVLSILPLCVAVMLSACGGGGGSGDVGSQVPNTSGPTTNDISPSGKVIVDGSGGKRVVVKSVASGSGGPISAHYWSVTRAIQDNSIPVPVLENANCVKSVHSFENNVARSVCEVTAIIPQVALNTTWILSNNVSAPSGDSSASVVIEAQPSLSGGVGVQIDSTNTTPSVSSEGTVKVSCTARTSPGLPSPVVGWSFGAIMVNGQPYAINPKSVVTQAEDGSVTNTLTIVAPAVTSATSLPMTCTATNPISLEQATKEYTLSVFPALMVPFNLLGGQVIVGSPGQNISLPVSIQDPTGQVTMKNAYIRWSQISGVFPVIPAGTYRYGSPLTFSAPSSSDVNNAQRYVFQAEASSVPWVDGMTVPDPQKAQVTFLNYPDAQPLALSINASQSVYTLSTVVLSANVSPEAGVKVTGYEWSFVSVPSGSTAQLLNANQSNASFVANVAGAYRVALKVNAIDASGIGFSRTSETIIYASAEPGKEVRLSVEAGAPQNISASTTVSLNGTEDVFGVTVQSRLWTILSAPATSTVTVVNASSKNAQFTPVVPGVYVMRYTVVGIDNTTNQSVTDSSDTTVLVSTVNQDITANAGAPLTGTIGSVSVMTGTAVASNGATVLSTGWSLSIKPAGSSALLIDSAPNQAQIIPDVAGTYVLAFRVDGKTLYGEPVVKYAYTTMIVN